MNIQFKRAITTMTIFGSLCLYLIVNFAIVGVDDFLNRTNVLITAAVVFLVIIAFLWILYQTEHSKNIVDERDHQIQAKAATIALIVTTMFVFLFSMGLFLGYEEAELVPVSWLWFLAYLTFAVAYFSTSTIIVLMYWRES